MKAISPITKFQDAKSVVDSVRIASSKDQLNDTERAAVDFLDIYGKQLVKLMEDVEKANWDLLVLGGEQMSTRKRFERKDKFEARIKKLQESYGGVADSTQEAYIGFKNNPEIANLIIGIHKDKDQIRNPFIKRQVELAYLKLSECKVAPDLEVQISKNLTQLKHMYGGFQPIYEGKKVDLEKLEGLINETRDPQEAIKLVQAKLSLGNYRIDDKGPTAAELILETVKLRNQFARKSGANNFYSYDLKKQEINESQLVELRKAVKNELKPLYDKLREKMDQAAVKRYGISKSDARLPWFQGGVTDFAILDDVMKFSPDKYFKGMDPRPYIKATAKKMGADADAIMDQSDLFPRYGKTPHWYMFSVNVPSDIRTIGNIDPKFKKRMGDTFATEFHEAIGHGLGFSFVDPSLPSILKDIHTITTESDAMMMESLMYNKHWLKEIAQFDDKTVDKFLNDGNQYRLAQQLLTFFKNYLLIPDFERELYYLPDDQLNLTNVNKLWVEKVDEYLGVKTPKDRNEPDWTYKIHFATAPVYYQCYFLGQLARAQTHAKINQLDPERGLLSEGTGDFLKQYRGVGVSYPWDELVQHMTGSPLNVEALKEEFKELNI